MVAKSSTSAFSGSSYNVDVDVLQCMTELLIRWYFENICVHPLERGHTRREVQHLW